MIKIYSFQPTLFNNNGDQGNVEVLKALLDRAYAAWADSSLEEADFVLVGDCSIAVIEQYKEELLGLIGHLRTRLESGLPTLLVGRSYELLAPHLGLSLQHGERVSKFVIESSGEVEVFGYHNSEVISPRLFVSGNFIGTTLFGPLLAKNPAITEGIVRSLGISLESEFWRVAKDYAQKVREATSFD